MLLNGGAEKDEAPLSGYTPLALAAEVSASRCNVVCAIDG